MEASYAIGTGHNRSEGTLQWRERREVVVDAAGAEREVFGGHYDSVLSLETIIKRLPDSNIDRERQAYLLILILLSKKGQKLHLYVIMTYKWSCLVGIRCHDRIAYQCSLTPLPPLFCLAGGYIHDYRSRLVESSQDFFPRCRCGKQNQT